MHSASNQDEDVGAIEHKYFLSCPRYLLDTFYLSDLNISFQCTDAEADRQKAVSSVNLIQQINNECAVQLRGCVQCVSIDRRSRWLSILEVAFNFEFWCIFQIKNITQGQGYENIKYDGWRLWRLFFQGQFQWLRWVSSFRWHSVWWKGWWCGIRNYT